MTGNQFIILTAILAITILEAFALFQGIDGTLLAGSIAIIAGLAGYKVATIKKKK